MTTDPVRTLPLCQSDVVQTYVSMYGEYGLVLLLVSASSVFHDQLSSFFSAFVRHQKGILPSVSSTFVRSLNIYLSKDLERPNMMRASMPGSPRRIVSTVLSTVSLLALVTWFHFHGRYPFKPALSISSAVQTEVPPTVLLGQAAQEFLDYPLQGAKYADQFGELGQRIQILIKWISSLDASQDAVPESPFVDEVIVWMFPFIRNPSNLQDKTPFTSLRKSFSSGSRGIVIPTGKGNFRFACHLILNIRNVLRSELPIQIAYAGDADLPQKSREILKSLAPDVEFLNVPDVLDDKLLSLATGTWAIKAFAILASRYEQVIMLDADVVFLQPPEVLFKQLGFLETGVLLFHDRLLWQHAFQDRHEWWKEQMAHQQPSSSLLKSKVWMEDYAEEADSGVVVIDKSRLEVLMGLLHICWQNTYEVREEITYKITYGDKESWWFGLDLSAVPYSMEAHYGSIIGTVEAHTDGTEKVCSFTIAHVDESEKLIWFNGSLLKNKAVDKEKFEVGSHWMMDDGTWEKGGSKQEMSCMVGGLVRELAWGEKRVLEESIGVAKEADKVESVMSWS
jgi:alpha 1,3-mannosyltransferase